MSAKLVKVGNFNMIQEGHVGGCLLEKDPATYMPVLWDHLIDQFEIQKILDVGCGMGYFIQHVKPQVEKVVGLDGSQYVLENSPYKENIIFHDFTSGEYLPEENFDLGWTCEFVEHVAEEYVSNYMVALQKCKYVAATYARPGQGGYNHVNEKPLEYWIEIFADYDLEYDEEQTEKLKGVTVRDVVIQNPKYKDNHFFLRGMFFKNKNLI
jgi:SAM-dependent methyltransferase